MTTDLLSSRSPPLLRPNVALLSDFDGTLVELAAHPDAVSPSAGLAGWLYQLEKHLGEALAIVTGRRLREVDRYLDPLRLMGAGAHGAELRVAFAGKTTPVIAPLEVVLIADIEAAVSALPGVWLENKTFALAVHFRQNPAVAAECFARVKEAASHYTQLEVFSGHAVVEVRRKGLGKGSATSFLLQHPAFAGRVPVFLGDDLADEECFAVVQALGGHGIKVGAGDTAARHRLADIPAVHRWLCESLMQLRRTP
ncbi:MAG: trehalose-phosphatase [Pseudomonadota bacterium]